MCIIYKINCKLYVIRKILRSFNIKGIFVSSIPYVIYKIEYQPSLRTTHMLHFIYVYIVYTNASDRLIKTKFQNIFA